jgi:ribosomal protein S18 acetylase RimI-like enzyme
LFPVATAFVTRRDRSDTDPSDSTSIASIYIRPLRDDDLYAVATIISDSFAIGKGWWKWMQPIFYIGLCEDLRSRLSAVNADRCYLVAAISLADGREKIVGTSEITMRADVVSQVKGQIAYIANVAVCKTWRRQGIARLLLDRSERMAADWSQQYVYLHVMADNPAALNLYSQRGYIHLNSDRPWHILPWRRRDRWLFRKSLTDP